MYLEGLVGLILFPRILQLMSERLASSRLVESLREESQEISFQDLIKEESHKLLMAFLCQDDSRFQTIRLLEDSSEG